jgi:hypothetical protein
VQTVAVVGIAAIFRQVSRPSQRMIYGTENGLVTSPLTLERSCFFISSVHSLSWYAAYPITTVAHANTIMLL